EHTNHQHDNDQHDDNRETGAGRRADLGRPNQGLGLLAPGINDLRLRHLIPVSLVVSGFAHHALSSASDNRYTWRMRQTAVIWVSTARIHNAHSGCRMMRQMASRTTRSGRATSPTDAR